MLYFMAFIYLKKYFRPSSRTDGTGEGRRVSMKPEPDGRDRISNFTEENKFSVKNTDFTVFLSLIFHCLMVGDRTTLYHGNSESKYMFSFKLTLLVEICIHVLIFHMVFRAIKLKSWKTTIYDKS